MKLVSKEIRLAKRPSGAATMDNFQVAEVTLAPLADRQVRVRNLWMSVDPYMRGRMRNYESYLPPFEIGKALGGAAVGEVVDSRDERFNLGDIVLSMFGWREIFDADPTTLTKPEVPVASPEMYLGVCGNTGHTAHIGLMDVIRLKQGETIFISAAAGAVGSIACQIAQMIGATVIASAGGAEKVEYVRGLGIKHVIDYKDNVDLVESLREHAPHGVDAYFDNVGGKHLDAALASARNFARFALCGMISGYDGASAAPQNLLMAIEKRLLMQGFLVTDRLAGRAGFIQQMNEWITTGDVNVQDTVEWGSNGRPLLFSSCSLTEI